MLINLNRPSMATCCCSARQIAAKSTQLACILDLSTPIAIITFTKSKLKYSAKH